MTRLISIDKANALRVSPPLGKAVGNAIAGLADVAALVGRIASARHHGEITSALMQATQCLGFEVFNLSLSKASPHELMQAPTYSNFDATRLRRYNDDNWAARDPLLQLAAERAAPLLWSTDRWSGRAAPAFLAFLRSEGVTAGLTVPLPEADGKHSALFMASRSARDHNPEAVLPAAEILAQTARLRSAALGPDEAAAPPAIRGLKLLSSRQREILDWMRMGKTNAEIAIILQLTKRGVDYHVREILAKLDVSSRTEAAALHIGP
ncbi:hypothetical protein HOY34_17870 [Xinfangfangia sp. D13-10-4-6]|uniref:autoinducer binding domain-containing protein n=1 Tax=Pseudogemmobacter hezensis TaxID=2737662 RepID=UPI0015580347|nr:autoinducer binding domain-containing protein [Pseudogemmobacter hezensis]NPD17065.1 hypothetical protein [Pseudogemmobacter hezensis]